MTGLLLVDDEGETYLVWYAINKPPKDARGKLLQWIQEFKKWQVQANGLKIESSILNHLP